MPSTQSPFHFHPKGSSFAARWRQKFFFDPKYLANPWEFFKNFFTALYLSPTATNSPWHFQQIHFWFGGRAPRKKFFWPQITQNSLVRFRCFLAQWSRLGSSWGTPNLVNTYRGNFEKLGKNRILKITPKNFDPFRVPVQKFSLRPNL